MYAKKAKYIHVVPPTQPALSPILATKVIE